MYRDSDVILICFDIGHPPSLQNVVNKVDTYVHYLQLYYFHQLTKEHHYARRFCCIFDLISAKILT